MTSQASRLLFLTCFTQRQISPGTALRLGPRWSLPFSTSTSIATPQPSTSPDPSSDNKLASLLSSLGPSKNDESNSCLSSTSSPSLPDVQEEEWDVVRFFPGGAAPVATTVSAAKLGLAPRDASLLRPDPSHHQQLFYNGYYSSSSAASPNGGLGKAAGAGAAALLSGGSGGNASARGKGAWTSAAAAAAEAVAAEASTSSSNPPAPSALAPPIAAAATTQRATLAPRDTLAVPPIPTTTEGVGGGGEARATTTVEECSKNVTSSSANSVSRRLILLRTEAVRAAIGADEAWVFPCRRDADTRATLRAVRDAAESSSPPPRRWFAKRGLPFPKQLEEREKEELLVLSSSGRQRNGERVRTLTFPPAQRAVSFDGRSNVVAAAGTATTTERVPQQQQQRLPFELAVLEALLSETVRQFERRHRQLKLLATGVEDDIGRVLRKAGGAGDVASASELQRLLPIARALNAMAHDVREARSAVAEVADSDRLLAAVCLSDDVDDKDEGVDGESEKTTKQETTAKATTAEQLLLTEHSRAAAALFESYERQLQSVEGALRELEEGLESARNVWNMSLAASRNRIINLNLRLTILTFSTAVFCATPSAMFGMNLRSGLEDVEGLFWPVAGWSVAGAALLALAFHAVLRWWPDASHRRRLRDLKALRDLLIHHLDDLDAISAAVVKSSSKNNGRLGKREFAEAVARAGVLMLPEEIDLLYRVYDADADGFVEVSEVIAAHDRAQR